MLDTFLMLRCAATIEETSDTATNTRCEVSGNDYADDEQDSFMIRLCSVGWSCVLECWEPSALEHILPRMCTDSYTTAWAAMWAAKHPACVKRTIDFILKGICDVAKNICRGEEDFSEIAYRLTGRHPPPYARIKFTAADARQKLQNPQQALVAGFKPLKDNDDWPAMKQGDAGQKAVQWFAANQWLRYRSFQEEIESIMLRQQDQQDQEEAMSKKLEASRLSYYIDIPSGYIGRFIGAQGWHLEKLKQECGLQSIDVRGNKACIFATSPETLIQAKARIEEWKLLCLGVRA